MQRHTKIISTIGPASASRDCIRDLVAAGTDAARLNFSHGTHEDHRKAAALIREEAASQQRQVTILMDLQGPRIRVGRVQNDEIVLRAGQRIRLTGASEPESTPDRISISYETLASDVTAGSRILMDDGRLELCVTGISGGDIEAKVEVGGLLSSNKGVNLPHVRTSGPALTEKDLADLEVGIELGISVIALSFVRNEIDVMDLRKHLASHGHRASIIAKIEKPEAVDCIDRILAVSDGIMVARGDLGIEMPMAEVPSAQKSIIHKCLLAGKPVITATQMLESMTTSRVPTRAEASDVANAVLDGTDAVMLSGETAVGEHPAHVVRAMSRIIASAENHWRDLPAANRGLPEELNSVEDCRNVTDAVTLAACELAGYVGAEALACLTTTGATARALAKHRPRMPVYAFTDEPHIVGQLGVLWGTKSFLIPFQNDTDAGVRLVQRSLLEQGLVRQGDVIVVCAGMPLARKESTNMVHVSKVE